MTKQLLALMLLAFGCLNFHAGITLTPVGRTAFDRQEEKPQLQLKITSTEELRDVSISTDIAGLVNTLEIKSIAAGEGTHEVPFAVGLLPGKYPVKVTLKHKEQAVEQEIEVLIVNSHKNTFPLIIYGADDFTKLPQYGFSHTFFEISDTVAKGGDINRELNKYAALGLSVLDKYQYSETLNRKFPRLNRTGKIFPGENTEALNPEVVKLSEDYAAAAVKAAGKHPAWKGAMINFGTQNKTNPSFDKVEPAAYKKFSGNEIPQLVHSRNCPNYQVLQDFPVSRIVPDTYPLWNFFRWFWVQGDGWNPLQGAVAKIFNSELGPDFLTLYQPSMEMPQLWGSGGAVNTLVQGVYSCPDPLKIAQNVDELIALSGKAGHQKQVIPVITGMWPRRQAAPGTLEELHPEWAVKNPASDFISVSPRHLEIALWGAISRRIDGLVVYGYGALFEPQENSGLSLTNPQSGKVVTDFFREVAGPLGPLVRMVPERKPEILILQSAASEILAGQTTGSSADGWIADIHLALQWANFQVRVVLEDQVINGALNDAKILVMPGCEVLPQKVFEEIKKFQGNAGFVIGDEYLVPGIVPDLMVRSRLRQGDPVEDKAAFQRLGKDIREALDVHFKPYVITENQDTVVRVRSYKNADYLFIINDKRNFGEYVGPWRKVLDEGVPNSTNIFIRRNFDYGYDLVNSRPLLITSRKDSSGFHAELDKRAGMLVMLLTEEINEVKLEVSEVADNSFKATVKVLNRSGAPVGAMLPLEVKLYGADDTERDGSGYYCAVDGVLEIPFLLSANEPPGDLKLTVKDRASGKIAMATIKTGPKK